MIDLVYKVVTTIINKENNGYVTPTEFNLLCYKVQLEIFEEYFDNENRDKNRRNRGLTNNGYGSLDFKQRQKISQLSTKITLSGNQGNFELPEKWYYIEHKGVSTRTGKVVEEVEHSSINYLLNTKATPTSTFPVFVKEGNTLIVYPNTINEILVRYIREPKVPNWTYIKIQGKELFDPSNQSYQDFEIHPSEFGNIVLRILSYFSINLREEEVTRIAETLKEQKKANETN